MDALLRLDEKAIQKVNGPSWRPLRETFLELSRVLLEVSDNAQGEMTTIYVKYLTCPDGANVYAVVWLKTSKRIVVGLSLPEAFDVTVLEPAPAGMTYRGLTQYLTILPGDSIPTEFTEWVKFAFQTASGVI